MKGIKTLWVRTIAGTGIFPICHRAEKPWHVPTNCPLLKELNLKLLNGPLSAPSPALAGSPAPAPAADPPAPSPGGHVTSTDGLNAAGLGLVLILAGALFYPTVTFSFL